MDINSDTEKLNYDKQLLSTSNNQFGDINIQMINMITRFKQLLEGNQMDLAEISTFEFINRVKNVKYSIEDNIRFLNELNDILYQYLGCKFKEI